MIPGCKVEFDETTQAKYFDCKSQEISCTNHGGRVNNK